MVLVMVALVKLGVFGLLYSGLSGSPADQATAPAATAEAPAAAPSAVADSLTVQEAFSGKGASAPDAKATDSVPAVKTRVAAAPAPARTMSLSPVESALAAEAPAAQADRNATDAAPANADELSRKAAELSRREASLKSLEQELNGKLARMAELELRIKAMLDEAKAVQDEKLKHLIDVYTNMKSTQAAAALENLDEGIAVKILAGMRGRQAGEILSAVNTQKAARLSEALTRMQIPAAN